MKTIVVYYSFSGHAEALAKKCAEEQGADIAQIKDLKPFGRLKAYSLGCFAAMRGKAWPIAAGTDLSAYDNIVLFAPIWASNVPPAVNGFINDLPSGKTVSLKFVSASGHSGCAEKVSAKIKAKGCTVEGFEDIKG